MRLKKKIIKSILFLLIFMLGINFTAAESQIGMPEAKVLPMGLLSYSIPQTMILGQSYIIAIEVSPLDPIEMGSNPDRYEKIQRININPTVSTELIGDNFEIIHLNEKNQIIMQNTSTQWFYNIIPLEPGKQTISVKLYYNIARGIGENETFVIPSIPVQVIAEPDQPLAQNFLKNFWYFTFLFLIPIIIYFGRILRKHPLKELLGQEKVDEKKYFKSPELNEIEVVRALTKLENDVNWIKQLVFASWTVIVLGIVAAIVKLIIEYVLAG